jgi:hypothetical protein
LSLFKVPLEECCCKDSDELSAVEAFRRRTNDDKLSDEDNVGKEENPSAGTMAIAAMTRTWKRTIVASRIKCVLRFPAPMFPLLEHS